VNVIKACDAKQLDIKKFFI